MKSLSKFIVFSFACLLIYTIVSQVLAVMQPGTDLSTLTTCFFGAFGGEVLMCALIKIFKLKEENHGGNDDDAALNLQPDDGADYRGSQTDDSGENAVQ